MAKKLYVGNLSFEVTEDELSQLFSQCGQVIGARIIKDRDSGRSKGFGFVDMPNDDEAMQAVMRMKGYDLKGRELIVDFSTEPEPGGARPPSASGQPYGSGSRSSGGGNRGGRGGPRGGGGGGRPSGAGRGGSGGGGRPGGGRSGGRDRRGNSY